MPGEPRVFVEWANGLRVPIEKVRVTLVEDGKVSVSLVGPVPTASGEMEVVLGS